MVEAHLAWYEDPIPDLEGARGHAPHLPVRAYDVILVLEGRLGEPTAARANAHRRRGYSPIEQRGLGPLKAMLAQREDLRQVGTLHDPFEPTVMREERFLPGSIALIKLRNGNDLPCR
jgi:hypothetical protein